MKSVLKNNVEGVYALTNHLVDNAKATEKFNQNHMAKSLIGLIDQYKDIIDYLLLEEKEEWVHKTET